MSFHHQKTRSVLSICKISYVTYHVLLVCGFLLHSSITTDKVGIHFKYKVSSSIRLWPKNIFVNLRSEKPIILWFITISITMKKKSTRSKSGNKSHQWTKLNETKSFDQPIIHHLCWVLNQGIWQGFLELSNPCVNPCSFLAPHQGPPNCEQTCSLFARSTNCTNKPSCANNEQCKQFDLCEQRTMRTVHTERTVGIANRANSEEYEHFIACE